MNLKSVLVSIMAILSSQITQAGESHLIVPVSDLEDLGISAKAIQEEFYNRHQVNIDWDEYLKVSKENEGKEIRFETYDNFSTIVPIARAHGTFNKKGN